MPGSRRSQELTLSHPSMDSSAGLFEKLVGNLCVKIVSIVLCQVSQSELTSQQQRCGDDTDLSRRNIESDKRSIF